MLIHILIKRVRKVIIHNHLVAPKWHSVSQGHRKYRKYVAPSYWKADVHELQSKLPEMRFFFSLLFLLLYTFDVCFGLHVTNWEEVAFLISIAEVQ